MLEKLRFKKEKSLAVKVKIPKHIAITMEGIAEWEKKHEKHAYERSFSKVMDIMKQQIKMDIPILTFYVLKEKNIDNESLINEFSKFISSLTEDKFIHDNKIKIGIIGKWYDLPNNVVEPIKKIIDITKEYEEFYLNFCLNYNGQEEIVDACKLIARKVEAEKIEVDSISKEMIKENLYSSYFIPPEIIIVNGTKKKKTDLLLWDSANSLIFFTKTLWPDFDKSSLMDAINDYQKS
jgi:undecaprenyl diphosphate synthase